MYDGNQKSIESEYDTSFKLLVLYLTQILDLAMGFGRKELGLNVEGGHGGGSSLPLTLSKSFS